MEDSVSQVPGNSCSIPSEPPDIGNWFSSYKFESFVLDTYDPGNPLLKDTENEEIGVDAEEDNRKREDNNICESREQDRSFSEIPNSFDPASLVSEPPDIGNWFSSYKFESFVLDTHDSGNPLSRDTENEENGKREDNVGESREQDRSFSEIPNSLDPASLVPEPPDIRNWSQSYIYKSPALCTRDVFESSAHDESECEKDTFVNGDNIKKKDESSGNCDELRVSDVKCSSGLVKCSSAFGISKLEDPSSCKKEESDCSPSFLSGEPPDIKNWFSSYTYESPPVLSVSVADDFRDTPFEEKCSEEDYLVADIEDSDKEEQESLSNVRKVEAKDEITPDRKLSSSQFEKEHLDNESEEDSSSGHSSEAKLEPEGTERAPNAPIRRGALFRKPAERSDKENEEAVTENGFITTRKKRFSRENQENTSKRTREIVQENVVAGKNITTEERKVLGETMNIQHCEEIGVTGKWRCPQKNKPQRGPPMKQLRLEQWVRRV